MQIINPREKILDATESSAKGSDNFAVDVENVEQKCERSKKKKSTLFLF